MGLLRLLMRAFGSYFNEETFPAQDMNHLAAEVATTNGVYACQVQGK
jgi:hypothetical protein